LTVRFTGAHFASSGEDIYYEVAGDAEDVVVLGHGLGGNHAVWFQQVAVLAERYRVVTWDQRGFGMSSNRAGASGPPAATDDLTALLDHLGVERAHLVGQSMGGWAVVGVALRAPERVRSLVLADTIAGIGNEAIGAAMRTLSRRTVEPGVLGAHPAVGAEFDRTRAFLYQQLGGFRTELDEADMIGTLFSTHYPAHEVAKLAVPVLCVVGSEDDLMPPAAIREVAAVLADARFVEIPGAGHSPYFEQPDAWNAAVLDFLESVARE
jgi:pimeloyl-ACP methyl ester carboxylesterase